MRVYSRLLRTESVFCRGHGEKKKQFLPDSITTPRPSWRGNRRLGGTARSASHKFPDTGVEQRGPSIPEMCTYKLDFTSQFPPPLNVSKLFSPTSFPATCTPDVTPNPSSVRTHPSQIHFAGNCLKVLFRSLT